MAPPTVRADYDQLQQVASGFSQSEQTLRQMLQSIKQNKDTLRGGDWVGQGATAFYKEMDDSVLPTLQRLINALDTAAAQTAKISSIMKEAEDQAANVLKGPGGAGAPTGSTAGGGAAATGGGGSSSAGGAGASGGNGATSGAASGSGGPSAGGGSSAGTSSDSTATGGTATGGAGGAAAGGGSSSPAMTPPGSSSSTRTKVEQTVTGIGLVASTLSILEAGGAAAAAAAGGTVAAAGVGTTIGAILLPIGAFLLGTSIAEQREREEALMDEFKMKMVGGAMLDSTHMAVAQLQSAAVPLHDLNDKGMAAVKDLQSTWKDTMHDDINQQMFQDAWINHAHPEAAWQARYDSWTKGMSKDLASIYANPQMTK
jgi:WXG100 family type VII secretion target